MYKSEVYSLAVLEMSPRSFIIGSLIVGRNNLFKVLAKTPGPDETERVTRNHKGFKADYAMFQITERKVVVAVRASTSVGAVPIYQPLCECPTVYSAEQVLLSL